MSIPLLVRHLGVEEFGRYVAVLSLINIAALATDLGLSTLALREWAAAEPAARPPLLRSLLGLRLLAALLGAAAAIVFAAIAGYPGEFVLGAAIAAASLIALAFGDFAKVVLTGRLELGRVAAVELARSLLATLAIVALVLAGSGVVPFFGAVTFAALASTALALVLVGRGLPLLPRLRTRAWRPLLADAAMYAAATAVYVLYFRVVMVIVSLDAGATEAGLFAVAYRVVELVAAMAGIAAASATPLLARAVREHGQRLRDGAVAITRAGLLSGILVALALGLGAPTIMDLIGGDGTERAAAVLRIEAPAVATTFTCFCMGAVLLALQRYRALLLTNGCALGVAVAAALALVPAHGARGAAAAVVAGELVLAGGQALAVTRALPVAHLLVRSLFVGLGAAAASLLLFVLLPLPNGVATALAVAMFVALIALARELPPELRAAFASRRPA